MQDKRGCLPHAALSLAGDHLEVLMNLPSLNRFGDLARVKASEPDDSEKCVVNSQYTQEREPH